MQALRSLSLAAIAVLAAITWTHAGLGQEKGAGGEQEGPPAVVRAERCSYVVTNLDLWGKQVTVTELWFPDAGIVCALGDAYGPTGGMRATYCDHPGDGRELREALERAAREHAAEGSAQPLELAPAAPREPVDVPRAAFERIQRLADLAREHDRLAAALGSDTAIRSLFQNHREE